MKMPPIETASLTLSLRSAEEARAAIDALSPADKRETSPQWLARIGAATESDPWLHGFSLTERVTGKVVGQASFKAPPDSDGAVEIAYAITPEHEGKGYATEAAAGLTSFALRDPDVRIVRAHTRPEPNASASVLAKCGFQFIGEVTDPEDGLVWRWETARSPA